jgi:hypothetical protein
MGVIVAPGLFSAAGGAVDRLSRDRGYDGRRVIQLRFRVA